MRKLSSLAAAVLRIAIVSAFMWSCSNSDDNGDNDDSGGSKANVAVVGDNTNTEMSEFLEGQGLEVDNYDLFHRRPGRSIGYDDRLMSVYGFLVCAG